MVDGVQTARSIVTEIIEESLEAKRNPPHKFHPAGTNAKRVLRA